MQSKALFALLGLSLAACQVGDGFEDYYAGATAAAPTISSISVQGDRTGNTGGQAATIQGSGFGGDASGVVVVIGDVNATILDVTDSSIDVIVPQGPVQGGKVDVVVGTAGGRAVLTDGFEYPMPAVYDDQSAYIVVNNDWFSCYGGIGPSGCENLAYNGYTGITGRAEFLDGFTFPYQQGQFVGYWGGADVRNEWVVDKPGYEYISLDIEGGVEDLRVKTVSTFSLQNPALASTEGFCSDLSALGTYYYGGGDPITDDAGNVVGRTEAQTFGYSWNSDVPFVNEPPNSDGDRCEDPRDRNYRPSELKFCEAYNDRDAALTAYERAGTWVYNADWPVGEYFFMPESEDINDYTDPDASNVSVALNVPELEIQGVNLTLPPWAPFTPTTGLAGPSGFPELWGVGDFDACPGGDDDGASTLDEDGVVFQWYPADLGTDWDDGVKDVNVSVRLALSAFYLGWYGGESTPMRASIVVPDDNNYDPETGLSSVTVPNWVLMQFPTLTFTSGPQDDPFGGQTWVWGDPEAGDAGYLIVTMERLTDYRVEAPTLAGDLVFTYATGNFGFFFWHNPTDAADSCSDCQDNDGDGWADAMDPDCADGGTAEDDSAYGSTTCNDGIDNDGDGLIDSDDPDCEDGLDGETNCSDGIDNDEDGWTDLEDGECGPGGTGVEVGDDDPSWQCNNGADDDGDGWIDFDDPDCVYGFDDEVGFGDTACNNGIDDDGHFDPDATDLTCLIWGATYDSEQPEKMSGQCADGIDNDDGDGYVDENDPDCELPPYSVEAYTEGQADWFGWSSTCYNGINDDKPADKLTDAADPDCTNPVTGVPDGFLDTEAP